MNQALPKKILDDHLKPYVDDGYVFDDKRFEFVNRWTYILMQLTEAKNFLELANKSSEYEDESTMNQIYLHQALFRSFVISYAKCFSTSGQGRLSLNKKDIYKNQPDNLTVHERVIDIRNKFVAHSDDSGVDVAVLGVKEMENKILIKHTYTLAQINDEYDSFSKLITTAEDTVISKVNKALDAIQKTEGKPVSFK